MAYTAQLTVGLQKKALDIIKAYQHIKVVMDTVVSVRQSADEYHEKWFIEAVDMAKSVDVQPAMPRICSDKHSMIMHLLLSHQSTSREM